MKKDFVLAFVLGITMVCCGQKAAQSDNEAFDITKFLDQIKDNPELRYALSSEELSPKEYALVDIDGEMVTAEADEDTMDEESFPMKYINEKVAEADEREGEPFTRYAWVETVTTEESA